MKKIVALPALLLLLGLFPLRAEALGVGDMLSPVGRAVAIELETKGVLVAGLAQVETAEGSCSPAGEAGLQPGDCITAVNGVEIHGGQDFISALGALEGESVALRAERDGCAAEYTVHPALGSDGERYLGLWLRSTISGIGTVTFQDPASGLYGALGHGVCLGNGSSLTAVNGGVIAPASVPEVVAGQQGAPGELMGVPESGETLGDVRYNTEHGIFGYASGMGGEAVEAGSTAEITTGAAVILSTVTGSEPREYAVEITRVQQDGPEGRQIALRVTDERLLAITGGIIQGMSGSPILQNGRIVGAVTHVLVNDPTRGYGISIEDMLEAAEEARQKAG